MRRQILLSLTSAILVASVVGATPAGSDCVGNVSDDFGNGSLSPNWTDLSGANGNAAESGGRLVLTKAAGVVGAATARMTSPRVICGNFDITVDYDLGSFPAASAGGGRYHTMILRDVSNDQLVAGMERYREPSNSCIPFTDSYKFYTTNPGCTPTAIYVATTDVVGKFRLARTGATIRGYYWNGASWVESMNRAIIATPVYLDFDSGTNGTLNTGHVAYFDNLLIQSSLLAPGIGPAGLIALVALVLSVGVIAIQRRSGVA